MGGARVPATVRNKISDVFPNISLHFLTHAQLYKPGILAQLFNSFYVSFTMSLRKTKMFYTFHTSLQVQLFQRVMGE